MSWLTPQKYPTLSPSCLLRAYPGNRLGCLKSISIADHRQTVLDSGTNRLVLTKFCDLSRLESITALSCVTSQNRSLSDLFKVRTENGPSIGRTQVVTQAPKEPGSGLPCVPHCNGAVREYAACDGRNEIDMLARASRHAGTQRLKFHPRQKYGVVRGPRHGSRQSTTLPYSSGGVEG
jgi:hypothetical protein